MIARAHEYYKCRLDCDDAHCVYCRGGLASCVVCGGAEAELTKHCAGRRLTTDELSAVEAGSLNYIDGKMDRRRAMIAALLNLLRAFAWPFPEFPSEDDIP